MWWKFLSGIYRFPYKIMMVIRANPIGILLYSIFAKSYLIVVISAVIVLYWVYTGLEKRNIISSAFTKLSDGIAISKAVAQHCTPKILELPDLWNCLTAQNSKTYDKNRQSKNLQNLEDFLDKTTKPLDKNIKSPDPYD